MTLNKPEVVEQRRQVVPGGVPIVAQEPVRNSIDLQVRDPSMHQAVQAVAGALKEDMLPEDVQMLLVDSMSPTVRRQMVSRIAGLDASVLMTFKQQIQLVDTVLRRIVNQDGTITASSEDYDIPLKDALNLSLRVTQVMVRDLPKIYTIDRVQRQEEALRRVMQKCLTREQQDEVLMELENIEKGE